MFLKTVKTNNDILFYLKKGLSKLNETQRNDSVTLVSLWRYEIFATIGSQLPRYSDLYWLESTVEDLIKNVNIFILYNILFVKVFNKK